MSSIKRFFDKFIIPPENYSISFSFAVLAVAALWSLMAYIETLGTYWKWGAAAYALFFVYAMLGVWFYFRPQRAPRMFRFIRTVFYITPVYVIALIATDMCELYNLRDEVCYAHLFIPLFVVLPYLTKHRENKDILDLIVFLTDVSLTLTAVVHENWKGLTAVIVHAIVNFVMNTMDDSFDMTPQELYNFGMAFFCYLSLRGFQTAVQYRNSPEKYQESSSSEVSIFRKGLFTCQDPPL